NTGNDFIYPDNYKDNIENYLEITGQSSKLIGGGFSKLSTNTETDGRYHSNWLNMMYPRLKLAKNLLTDDGVIFISIDDNEEGNLKKMCDEIFGEDNFIANLIRRTRKGGGSMSKYISSDHDYILVYTRKISSLNRFLVPYNKDYLKRYNEEDEKSKFFWDTFARNRQGSSNNYTITAPDGQKLKKAWIYKKDKYEQLLKEGEIRFKKLNNSWSVQIKQRINKGQIMRSILNDFINKKGTKTINDLLGNEIFTYTKPVELTEYFLNLTKNDDIILDFFSGSGTTAHSVLKSNLEKNKHNNFILIQIPEPTDEKSEAYKAGYKNICEIGKERIRRAGDKILEESDNKDLDIGFKVFKLDSSNLQKWDPDYKNLTESLDNYVDNIKTDRTEEDLVYEIMLKYGIDLTLPIQKENTENHTIYSVGHGALLICLDDNITKDITKPIIDLGKDSISTRVVFKDNGFKSDSDKTNIKETLKVNNIKEFITI
uniref:site-specific DNA-methyltransferase n=1 Tax=uncultured Methanobrevibacter sp. TaxID=253161 RepID=UPI00258A2A6A